MRELGVRCANQASGARNAGSLDTPGDRYPTWSLGGDIEQIPLRLPKLIKAQNHKFSGGQWLVFDNNGVKPSEEMRKAMEKAMADKHVDGWMEVD